MYHIQVGAFKDSVNADRAFAVLKNARLNPSLEIYEQFTRVIIAEVRPKEIPFYREKLKSLGFAVILIRRQPSGNVPAESPVSDAVLPSSELKEIASRTIQIRRTMNLSALTAGKNVMYWKTSTPSVIGINSDGIVTGLNLGNGYIQINEREFISIAVVPQEEFYTVPRSMESTLPPESMAADSDTEKLTEYRTEPTFRLAWRYNNRGEHKGASGENGGIDILGRGADYQWLWTTYEQGGWFYDLNGVKHKMINGYQKDDNGVELTVLPEFVYEKGIPYLQLNHRLRNTNNVPVSGQKFGASADVMIHNNDNASLLHRPYGAYMADSLENPAMELMFVGESGYGITPVDTLWLGRYNSGNHLECIYDTQVEDIHNVDSAIGFSYRNIDLAPGETKVFTVRFTLARGDGDL